MGKTTTGEGNKLSILVMGQVWESSRQKGAALLLLLAISDHAHDNGSGAYPSIRRLAKRTRMSVRSTQRLAKRLEAQGEIKVDRGAGPHGTNLYTVNLDGLYQLPLPALDLDVAKIPTGDILTGGGDSLTPQGGVTTCREGGDKAMSPKPSLNLIKEKRVKKLTPLSLLWNKTCKGFPRVLDMTPGRQAKERARLRGRQIDFFSPIFEKIAASEFLRGANERGWVATFDWIISSEENILKVREGKYNKSKLQTVNGSSGTGKAEIDRAWAEVLREVSRVGSQQKPTFSTPELTAAVKAIGWGKIAGSTVQEQPFYKKRLQGSLN